jgi:hypothetical protein
MYWLFRPFGFRSLKLGALGESFMSPNSSLRFDENFYYQARVPFRERWESFSYPRRTAEEDSLVSLAPTHPNGYIFLHEDVSRGYTIDRSLLTSDLPVFTPIAPPSTYFVSDYAKVIENAAEIHVIESSFAALVEGLAPKGKLFAHRYARPEAKGNWRHEFTYQKNWKVFL